MSVDIIYNRTAVPPTLYSSEDALNSATGYGIVSYSSNGSWGDPSWDAPLEIYRNGCITANGNWNCTQACQDIDQIFSSVYTLQNCMVFPQISSLVAKGSLTEAARATALEAGIDEHSYNTSNTVYEILDGCLQGWCQQQPRCTLSGNIGTQCYEDAYGQRFCFRDLCLSTEISLNTDIGGIGIYASYWMQSGIALAIQLLFRIYTSWTYYIIIALLWPWGARSRRFAQEAQERARKHLPALISATVEYQKAQCFFMIALQIAAQIVLSSGDLEAANLLEFEYNYEFLGIVSLGGILPIIYTLAFLQIAGQRSWYLFILSAWAIAVSIATLFRISYSSTNLDVFLNKKHSIPDCGTQDPTMFCSVTWSWAYSITDMRLGSYRGAGATLVISLVVFGLLLLDQVRIHRLPAVQRFLSKYLRSITQPSSTQLSSQMKIRRRISYVTLWILYLAFWGLYVFLFLKYFGMLLGWYSPKTTWTFGQIVAITVWAPSVLEYGYLEALGMEKGSAYHIAAPYKLINGDKQKTVSRGEKALKGRRTSSLPAVRHDSEGGISPSEASEELQTPNARAEETEYTGGDVSTSFLIPLSESPDKPKIQKEGQTEEEEKKYIGDDVITSFLQDPLTTILY